MFSYDAFIILFYYYRRSFPSKWFLWAPCTYIKGSKVIRRKWSQRVFCETSHLVFLRRWRLNTGSTLLFSHSFSTSLACYVLNLSKLTLHHAPKLCHHGGLGDLGSGGTNRTRWTGRSWGTGTRITLRLGMLIIKDTIKYANATSKICILSCIIFKNSYQFNNQMKWYTRYQLLFLGHLNLIRNKTQAAVITLNGKPKDYM